MTAEGIRLTPNPFACLDAECAMEEDPGPNAPTYLEGPTRKRLAEVSFRQLDGFFKLVPLPRDDELKEKFDLGSNLLLGDPIPLGGQDVPEYETRAPAGFVGWNALFSHLISLRDLVIVCDTVYILVDNRDLSDLRNAQDSVPHWPPAAAWWASRVQLVGPFRERTDVVSIRICEATGLANVHPTWAGTFVLAGMVALYTPTSILLSLTMIACRSRSLKLLSYGIWHRLSVSPLDPTVQTEKSLLEWRMMRACS